MNDGKVTIITPPPPAAPIPTEKAGGTRVMGAPFPKGNQLWKLRKFMGKPKEFETGEELWEQACQYFEWCDRNPWVRPELVKYQGVGEEYLIPLGRPYVMDALCVFLGVSKSYFRGAAKHLRDKVEKKRATEVDVALLHTIEQINMVVRYQQIEGAVLNVFNANVVSRLQGLAENINGQLAGETVLRITVRDQETADNMDILESMI